MLVVVQVEGMLTNARRAKGSNGENEYGQTERVKVACCGRMPCCK